MSREQEIPKEGRAVKEAHSRSDRKGMEGGWWQIQVHWFSDWRNKNMILERNHIYLKPISLHLLDAVKGSSVEVFCILSIFTTFNEIKHINTERIP